MKRAAQSEFTEAWLCEAIDTVSFCIVRDGPVYAPILERLERELKALQDEEDIVARARRNLEARQRRLLAENQPAG